jgi:MoaA/NifB/PqqE/SkfB family radical SAM enzyme
MANLGYIQVTRRCNQRCRFCSNPPTGLEATLADASRLVEDLVARGYDGVVLTGGEPTLVPWLGDLIRHAHGRGLRTRIITNGQLLAEGVVLDALGAAGLDHVHVSMYSHTSERQDFLARHEGSHARLVRTLERLGALAGRVTVDVNCVINHYNAGELDANVRFIVERFPFVRHLVWNNLDPRMSRVRENPETIPRLAELELGLQRAMRLADEHGLTFRVERVPLCYMVEYAHCSTETRAIVKHEERIVHFLDQQGMVRHEGAALVHGKAAACAACRLDPICAGLDGLGDFFDGSELYPVFVDPRAIVERIRDAPRAVGAVRGIRP